MKFSLDASLTGYGIRGYSDRDVTVAYPPESVATNVIDIGGRPERPRLVEEKLSRSFIITPLTLIRDWEPQRFESLMESHLQRLSDLEVEVVLLGTGARARFPAASWLAPFARRGVGIEIMDTGAACRTYGVLVAEGRHIAAAIILG